MAKKGKRVRRREDPVGWFLKQNRRWLQRLAILAGLAAFAVAVWFVVDPLQGAPKAIDESGQEVSAGVIDTPGAEARTGRTAPNFVLPDYEQRAVYLDQFRGKIVLINFWASWCTFCDREMPDIFRLAKRFPNDVVVLAVNRGESKGTAEKWTGARDFPELPNVYWLLDQQEDVVRKYRVEGMPQSFFIDGSGRVASELRRVTEFEELQANAESLGLSAGG